MRAGGRERGRGVQNNNLGRGDATTSFATLWLTEFVTEVMVVLEVNFRGTVTVVVTFHEL